MAVEMADIETGLFPLLVIDDRYPMLSTIHDGVLAIHDGPHASQCFGKFFVRCHGRGLLPAGTILRQPPLELLDVALGSDIP